MSIFTHLAPIYGNGLGDILKANASCKGSIKENMDDLCEILEDEILKSSTSDEEKKELLKRLRKFSNTQTNIMLVGATGCGKSSTINALFAVGGYREKTVDADNEDETVADEDELDEAEYVFSADDYVFREEPMSDEELDAEDEESLDAYESEETNEFTSDSNRTTAAMKNGYVEVAKVGTKADPETKDIEKYRIGNLVLWDTPGLGDGTEIDEHHKKLITELLREKDDDQNALIDLVLVILDGSTKDLGTSYKILNEVIIPELNGDTGRILIALNQADIAMKTGRHWDYEKNEPDETLVGFLNEKVESIKTRIKEDSCIDVAPVYYCAGYVEKESGDVVHPYNLSKLLYYIMNSLPNEKRVAIMEGINTDSDNYEYNDDDEDYNEEIKDSFYDSFDYIGDGVDAGVDIGGKILGLPGAIVGGIIGGCFGCVHSILDAIFG